MQGFFRNFQPLCGQVPALATKSAFTFSHSPAAPQTQRKPADTPACGLPTRISLLSVHSRDTLFLPRRFHSTARILLLVLPRELPRRSPNKKKPADTPACGLPTCISLLSVHSRDTLFLSRRFHSIARILLFILPTRTHPPLPKHKKVRRHHCLRTSHLYITS